MTKRFWTIALTFGLPWTIIMIVINLIIKDGPILGIVVSTLMGGIVAGLLFAWMMQYTAKRLFKRITIETADNEEIIKEGGANHFKGKEGVGGKLLLTDKRLIFKSHKFNIQNHQDNFDLGQVEKLQVTKTCKFLENGLTLELKNGDRHKFIVDEPADWMEKIMNQQQLSS
ncbi:GRAM domain-containing protein [Lunatimonas salinarum]|uniref:GRAM domain-containing protein n=1 Tax=Lunatimonas salinarum TaxID=1774590 RepID=UPI001AE0690A|nr:GRAM domain-containing protein [Lunatimonas salinarum]